MKSVHSARRGLLMPFALCTALVASAQLQVSLTASDYSGYNISCFGGRNGAIDATITGGTPPYDISWSNSATTEDIQDLASGLYIITVTDGVTAQVTAEVTLTEPTALRVGAVPFAYPSGMNISCNECFNGSIDVTVTDGVAPYTYAWRDGPTTQDRSALGSTSYEVMVTDANNCKANSAPIFLRQPERNDWEMDGNENTDPATQYIGTADEQDVVFKTNGTERMRITSDGDLKLNGVGGAGVLGIDANGAVGSLDLFDDVPCEDDLFPFWRTGGNNLLTCDPSRAYIGSIDNRGFGVKTNDLVRMQVVEGGEITVGSSLESYTGIQNAGRMNVVSGHGNWLTLQAQPVDNSVPAFWGLHNPQEQDRLMFFHQPATGDPLYDVLTLYNNGKVSIGDVEVDPADGYDYGLYVHKGILTEKVKVAIATEEDWKDDVFRKDYVLMSLADVRKHIKQHGHLPGVPSAAQMVEHGLDVAATDAILLGKIEELTLYILALEERIKELEKAREP